MPYTQARVDAALDAANDDVTHAQLHDDDPGGAGTSNVLAQSSRVAISLPPASSGESEQEVEFTITGATDPITHVTLWDGPTGGTFQGSGALTPEESFAGEGTLTVTVTTSASST